jgi:hypoxanthine phosphoribosyltransferase
MKIQLLDKRFEPYLFEAAIQSRVRDMAQQISLDLEGSRPLFIAILNGSFMFAADIFRHLSIEAEISFVKLASYEGTESSGKVITAIGLDRSLTDRTIVILEDIIDTGRTLAQFIPTLLLQNPKRLLVASLLHKPDATQQEVKIDYLGFEVPNVFLLGYGLDYKGVGRNLPDIYRLSE